MTLEELKKTYNEACDEYLTKFCEKQDLKSRGWIGENIGAIAECSGYCFNIHDVIWDMNTNQPKGNIINWYRDNQEHPEKRINYFMYTKGERITDIQ